ncbi:TMV resistance protein N [Morella rubra]|uniref:TMV resistance protein N n=1 Tax=Morella rubra TaxID=262757 RepID=A0A6A1WK65_9ROSI|nr:TMV resistance protein N [Morella rubra]
MLSTKRDPLDTYLSYLGEKTHRTVTEPLYNALGEKGIHTFLSKGGNEFSAKQRQAMHQSGINLVVFSKEYCSSLAHGHLDELVEMVNLKNTRDTPLIPIFYDIDPDDVRNQTGPFAEVFDMHENKSQVDCEKVRQWRKALAKAADSPKWVFRSAEHGYYAPVSLAISCIKFFRGK